MDMNKKNILVLTIFVILIFLTGCSDPYNHLAEFSVYERIEPDAEESSYYAAIRDQRSDYLFETLHPDEDLHIVTNGSFYGRSLEIEDDEVSRRDYVGSYDEYYFRDFTIDEIILDEINIIRTDDDTYTYQAKVKKTFIEAPDRLGDNYTLEYDVIFELKRLDGTYFITRIEKTN